MSPPRDEAREAGPSMFAFDNRACRACGEVHDDPFVRLMHESHPLAQEVSDDEA